jgi:similar to stage IV sporulation protein
LISYIKGYCLVSIEGLNVETFINHLIRNGVYVYNVNRISSTKVELSIYRRDLRKLTKIYRSSNFDVKIKRTSGLPFIMKRIYKRKTLWIGAVISLLLLVSTSLFVTDIYIQAPEGIDKYAVRKELYGYGLKPGVYKEKIDRKQIRDHIMGKFEDVAYVSINVKGTNVFVTITKKAESLKQNIDTNYCNIIAEKNGIIEKVIPRSGNAIVSKGDIVQKGNLLISAGSTTAIPEVWAKTFYESIQSAKYIEDEKIKTGNKKRVYTIGIYDKEYTIRRNIDYKNYVIENKDYKLSIGDYTFPVQIKISTFHDVNLKSVKKDTNEIKEKLKQKAIKELEYMIPIDARYVDVKHDYNIKKDTLEYIVTVEASENIAQVQHLTKSEAEQILKEQEEKQNEIQPQPRNPEKMPVNDPRKNMDLDTTEEEESDDKKNDQ